MRLIHRLSSCATALVVGLLALAPRADAAPSSELCFAVGLRGGVAQICNDVYENPNALPSGGTLYAVHGLTETAAAWGPFVDALFADEQVGKFVSRVIAVDLPGHGDSPPPVGLPGGLFGELLIDDNISVILQSIGILNAQGFAVHSVVGHSMGGLALQGAQEALLAQGSSFADLGVRHAILIAPVPVASSQWTQPPNADLTPFIITDPALGTFLALPPIAFQLGGSFRTTSGALIPNLPSLATLTPMVGVEPIAALLQLVGLLPIPRPDARQGAFAPRNATELTLVSFSEDILTPAVDQGILYQYLVGLPNVRYRPVVAPDAVHGMFISNPEAVVDALRTPPYPF